MSSLIEATNSALNADLVRLQSISQNMSNLNSAGYKREVLVDRGFSALVDSTVSAWGVPATFTQQDLSAGTLMPTQNPLDVAVEGDGYLTVRGANSESLLYTRRGQLMVNAQGYLALRSGELVLGDRGPIALNGDNFEIRLNGEIRQGDKALDRLQVTQLTAADQVQYVGNGLFQSTGTTTRVPLDEVRTLQGHLEGSNVNMMEEMVRLVEVTRHFELTHNVLRAYDGTLDSAINVLGNF